MPRCICTLNLKACGRSGTVNLIYGQLPSQMVFLIIDAHMASSIATG